MKVRLYKLRAEGMEFWSVIKHRGEKVLKRKVFEISKLKEGMNDGEWFNPTDIQYIKEEAKIAYMIKDKNGVWSRVEPKE